MAFQYPQFLYALFLLIIPILIHLFQLRKFKKTEFTNVALLQKISIQSRKSSIVKKYLVLLSRLLAITALVFAFAQPYLPNQNTEENQETEYVIYLDNSFSMEQKLGTKTIFEHAQQELVKYLPEDSKVSVFTNNETLKNNQNLANELLSLKLAPEHLSLEQVLLKSNTLFSKTDNLNKKLLLISDFQSQSIEKLNFDEYLSRNQHLEFVQLKPEQPKNISIEKALYQEEENQIELDVELSAEGSNSNPIDISIYDEDQLIARKQVEFEDQNKLTTNFKISKKAYPKSKIEIKSAGLTYDDTYYFSINQPSKLNVLSINQTEDDFLKRIYNKTNFNYSSYSLSNLPYSSINQSDVLILNELKTYSNNFTNALSKFLDEGGNLIVIPSTETNASLNQFLLKYNLPKLEKTIDDEIQLTKINFQHPIYKNTFIDEISNFDYPNFKKTFQLNLSTASALSFSNQMPALISKNKISLFTAALNLNNSNFQNSPLIVPTFYNLANLNRSANELQFTVKQPNSIKIDWASKTDEVLELVHTNKTRVIPQQQKYLKYVEISTSEVPEVAGNYAVVAQQDTLQYLSFNYERNQSQLNYYSFSNEASVFESIEGLFEELRKQQETKSFWHWFLIFALIFLLVEVLLLNYFKP
ncbi:MAG: BatA domain-containing protein [Psychroflexus maritimus]